MTGRDLFAFAEDRAGREHRAGAKAAALEHGRAHAHHRPGLDRDQTGLSALYRLYRTQDDDWIMIAAVKDTEWQAEFEAFLQEIQGHKTDIATPQDALRALEIVAEVYSRNEQAGVR